jgi:sulfite reductase (NADPH) flavoprotein alpha-component
MTASDTAELTILFGSQTGNAEYLAHQIHTKANKDGHNVAVSSLEDWLHAENHSLRRLLVVTSTHDNGHMPDNAAEFWEWLASLAPAALEGLPYAVLSIGDSMYEDFCKAGHDIDQRLATLGAVRVIDGIDCDIDFEFSAGKWASDAVTALLASPAWAADTPDAKPDANGRAQDGGFHTADPLRATRVVASRRLSLPGSSKQVVHYELAFDDGPFDYAPGDSISVFVANPDALVDEWVAAFGNPSLTEQGTTRTLRDILTHDVELRLPHPGLVVGLGRRRPDSAPIRQITELIQSGNRDQLDAWLWGRDVLDVLTELQCVDLPIGDILAELRPLQHRDYSIASSPLADAGRVHLTVGGVEYTSGRGMQRGAATAFLDARAHDGKTFPTRRLPAHEFQLPASDVPIIMVGPGVGVAPFRAFLRERDASAATGRSWLFFGDQHRNTDFLYEAEFTEFADSGRLTHLSLAFSRDQPTKHYVQHEMLAEGDRIRSWIADGACVFVCGDKARMAPDVDQALEAILNDEDITGASGRAALAELKAAGRYVKDVY